MTAILDASALLALLKDERGAEVVAAVGRGATISAVNLSEAYGKLVDGGMELTDAEALVVPLELDIVAFDAKQATVVASLRPATHRKDVSLADRACLAIVRGLPIYTGDRKWTVLGLDRVLGIDIRQIR